jgi:hypothetical protein
MRGNEDNERNKDNERNEAAVQALQAFIAADKYQLHEWSPNAGTGEADKKKVADLLNACAEEVLAALRENCSAKCVRILNRYTSEIPGLMLDTEDREFAHELLIVLAGIVDVADAYAADDPVSNFLNSFKGTPAHEILDRLCMECGCVFKVHVQAHLDLAPPFWVITRCTACNIIDYIELPQSLLQFSVEGFEWIEIMEQTLYGRTDVIARLERLLEQGGHLNGRTAFRYLK